MRSIVIGTAGHIDHGKSALVRTLTGTDPDRLKEERERGITIDLGFAHLDAGGVRFAFVDVPGHERFVKNMLAGAGGIDLVLLVVAADESVMPQTREHFHICRLLQVPAGLIVLTKIDLADPEMIELATLEVRELVAGSFLAAAPIVGVSARTGAGIPELTATLVSLAATTPERPRDGPVRLPIDRVFTVKGFGTVVTGTLVSGRLEEETELMVLPRQQSVKVRTLQVHGRREPVVEAGQRAAANLGGVEVSDLARGETVCSPGAFVPTRRIDVALEVLPDARPLRHGARVRFHLGTTELFGRLAIAGERLRSEGDETSTSRPVSVYARIRLESPAVVTRGDRFIVRAYSPLETAGGGVVLDPHPPYGPIRTPAGLARFARLDVGTASDDAAVAALVVERGGVGLERAALVARVGLTMSAADRLAGRLVTAGQVTVVGDLLVSPQVLADLEATLVADLKAHHAAHPLSEGVPREEVRERLFRRAAPSVFEAVVQQLVRAGRVVARERLALAGHQVSLSPDEDRARTAIERVYRDARLAPPDAASAATAAGVPTAIAERMVSLLLRHKTLVKIDTLIFHREALETLKDDVRGLKGGEGATRVDVASFKARYGMTRKYAIPLLEYLDRERVTRRVGDARMVL